MALNSVDFLAVAGGIPPAGFGDRDRVLIARFGRRADLALRAAIRGDSLRHIPKTQWNTDRDSIRRFAGIEDSSHCLNARGHDWLWPLERQATEGFAHFLSSGAGTPRRGRALAFLRALDPPRGLLWPEWVDRVAILAEQRVEKGRRRGCRVDLMIIAQVGEQRIGAVIEAKFDHDLSGNPLSTYVDEAARRGLNATNCSFLVVGVRNDPKMRATLDRNPSWTFQSWRRLTMAHERELSAEFDDEDYRRFRKTIILRAQ